MDMHQGKYGLRLLATCLSFGFVTIVATAAEAVEVNGKIVLGAHTVPPEPQSSHRKYYWELENGVKEVARNRLDAPRELAVVLLNDKESNDDRRVELNFSGGSLLPSTVVVKKGTTLRINNKDEIAHELYAQGSKAFIPESTSPKAIRSIELNEVGSWPLLDRLVTHLHGHLHVLANLVAIAKIGADGDFAFTDIEPGAYTLRVYHGANVLVEQSIDVVSKTDKKKEVPFKVDLITLATPSKSK
jgi:hypothetical protein